MKKLLSAVLIVILLSAIPDTAYASTSITKNDHYITKTREVTIDQDVYNMIYEHIDEILYFLNSRQKHYRGIFGAVPAKTKNAYCTECIKNIMD
jgi:hypothetical protein